MTRWIFIAALAACTSNPRTPSSGDVWATPEHTDVPTGEENTTPTEDPEVARLAREQACVALLDQLEFTSGRETPQRPLRDGVLWYAWAEVMLMQVEAPFPPGVTADFRGPRVDFVLRRAADGLLVSMPEHEQRAGSPTFRHGVFALGYFNSNHVTVYADGSGQSLCEPQMTLELTLNFDPFPALSLEDLRGCNRTFTFPVKLVEEKGVCNLRFREDIPVVPVADGWTPPPMVGEAGPTPWSPTPPPATGDSGDSAR